MDSSPTPPSTPAPAADIPPAPPPCHPDGDKHWFQHVYQGDRMPQLTVRAVLMGGILGMLMSAANLYTTLKIGWAFGVAITACVMSYVIWNALRLASGKRLSQMSILENNCMASTASAAGYSTGSTIATGFGALLLIQGFHQPVWIVATFTFFTAALGVFIAVPMKRQMINQEQLPFPTGIAAATTLRSLYSEGREAMQKAYVLIAGLFAGLLVGILNTGEGTLRILDRFFAKTGLHLPELLPARGYAVWIENRLVPFWDRAYLAMPDGARQLLGFGFEPSVLLIGAGMIVGMRVCLSMLAASALLYFWVGPELMLLDAARGAADPGYQLAIPLIGGGTIYHLPRWALWGGTSLMVFCSLTAFALQWQTIARSFSVLNRKACPVGDAETEARMAAIEVPLRWLVIGLIPITIGLLAVQYLAFQINLILGLISVALSFVLSLVAARATGETDTTPIGAMGKVMQLTFAVLSPGSLTHNLASASTAANAASSSADLLTDLKSGYLLGANPRKQFIAQAIGVLFGTVAVIPAWFLMVPNKEALEAFNPPATNMWKAVAEVLAGGGLKMIPPSAQIAIVAGAVLGVVIPLLGRFLPKSAPFLPSCMGLGLAWIMPFANAQAFAIGALVAFAWEKCHRRSAEAFNVPLSAGLIAGESLIKAIIAMAATALGLLGLS